MLKIGIIGAGRMGNSHAANLIKLKSIRLAAVYDIDPEKSKAFAEKYSTVKIMNSLQELVNSPEVELIIITSPTYCHRDGLMAAMATGKPIFCEKPLCRTRAELKELAPLILDYKNFFTIGFVRRYSPGCIMMKKLIDEGKIGKLICGYNSSDESGCHCFRGIQRWQCAEAIFSRRQKLAGLLRRCRDERKRDGLLPRDRCCGEYIRGDWLHGGEH